MAHYSAVRYSVETSLAISRGVASIRWARTNPNSGRDRGSPIKFIGIRYPDKSFSIKKIK